MFTTISILVSAAFTVSSTFLYVVFTLSFVLNYFLIPWEVFSLLCWLFNDEKFNSYIFKNFWNFLLISISNFIHYGWKTYFIWFQLLYIYGGLFLTKHMFCPGECPSFHVVSIYFCQGLNSVLIVLSSRDVLRESVLIYLGLIIVL